MFPEMENFSSIDVEKSNLVNLPLNDAFMHFRRGHINFSKYLKKDYFKKLLF